MNNDLSQVTEIVSFAISVYEIKKNSGTIPRIKTRGYPVIIIHPEEIKSLSVWKIAVRNLLKYVALHRAFKSTRVLSDFRWLFPEVAGSSAAFSHQRRGEQKRKSTGNNNRANKTSVEMLVFVSARVPRLSLKQGELRALSLSLSSLRSALQDPREPEKSRATNGMWQRVISPRLRGRRNNRFLFPSFRGSIFAAAPSLHFLAYREARCYNTRSPYPGTRRTKLRFRVGDIIKAGTDVVARNRLREKVARRETGSWKLSHMRMYARARRSRGL